MRRSRGLGLLVVCFGVLLGTGGHAWAVRRGVRATPPPPPPVALTLEPTEDRDEVVFALTNQSDEPVRIVADRFLLALELRAQKARGPRRRCPPPAGLAPRGVSIDDVVTLQPGARYAERIDVRFWCWGAMRRLRQKAHSLGATYGRPGRATPDRWVVSNEDGSGDHLARLTAEPIEIAAPPDAPAAERGPKRGLELAARDTQVGSGRELVMAVRVKNHGPDPVRLFLHPDSYRFHVASASGEVLCAMDAPQRGPSREQFTLLARRATRVARLDLVAYCPRDTFARPGVYEVRAEISPSYDGSSAGVEAFAGRVEAEPVVVRVRSGWASDPGGGASN